MISSSNVFCGIIDQLLNTQCKNYNMETSWRVLHLRRLHMMQKWCNSHIIWSQTSWMYPLTDSFPPLKTGPEPKVYLNCCPVRNLAIHKETWLIWCPTLFEKNASFPCYNYIIEQWTSVPQLWDICPHVRNNILFVRFKYIILYPNLKVKAEHTFQQPTTFHTSHMSCRGTLIVYDV